MPADVTLVINVSAGDAAYISETATALIQSHRETAKEIILIVDTEPAQFSTFYNHTERYRQPDYHRKIARVKSVADELRVMGLADKVLDTADFNLKKLLKKYLGNTVSATHDFRGAPIAAYLLGFEMCKTRYQVRYDGDMLLHQNPVEDWVIKGIRQLEMEGEIIAVSPRTAPATQDQLKQKGEQAFWFSTRCTLFDMAKFDNVFPLVRGKYRIEAIARKWLNKTYPPAFETMLTRRLKSKGLSNYYQLEDGAWLSHPEQKDEAFCSLLPEIILNIRNNTYPPEQTGREMLILEAWKSFLK